MKPLSRLGMVLFLFSLPILIGGAAEKNGIVKGTVRIQGKAAQNVVISVEGPSKTDLPARLPDARGKKAVMDQRELQFSPRVLAVQVGTVVEFPNNDQAWHSVFSGSEAKKFDLGLYPAGEIRSVTFDRPGVVKILCSVHPHMEAYIVVKEHPYFAVTDSRGNYRIDGVPLGKFRLEIWHPELAAKVLPFNLVREGEVLGVDMELRKKP